LRTEVAFLRAVNVAGHGMIKMSDLKRIFESAGCKNVRTYIQSGNVVFQSPGGEGAAIRLRVLKKLSAVLGDEVSVAFRTVSELRRTVLESRFGSLESDADVTLYVCFLSSAPKSAPALPLSSAKEGLEATRIIKHDVFVVGRRVKGRSGYPSLFIERELGVPATTRSWNTVRKMLALATDGDDG
jgi:uncharacterized protein (DUF1697 family)